MKQVAPLVIATLVAIGVALSSAFLSPQFVRPRPTEALDIIGAVAEYELLVANAMSGGKSVPPMTDAEKISHIRLVDTAPCGETEEPVECNPIEVEWGGETGRMLIASWHDAARRLESYRAINQENPLPKVIDTDQLTSPLGEKLLRLQVAATRQGNEAIVPSGLDESLVRQRIELRSDMSKGYVNSYSAPWQSGDIAFLEIGFSNSRGEGFGQNYALQKVYGKWRVIAIQPSWIS